MKQLLPGLIFALLISGCDNAPGIYSPAVLTVNLEATPSPDTYKLTLEWPMDFRSLGWLVNHGEEGDERPRQIAVIERNHNFFETTAISGKKYTYSLSLIDKSGVLFSKKVTILLPKDSDSSERVRIDVTGPKGQLESYCLELGSDFYGCCSIH